MASASAASAAPADNSEYIQLDDPGAEDSLDEALCLGGASEYAAKAYSKRNAKRAKTQPSQATSSASSPSSACPAQAFEPPIIPYEKRDKEANWGKYACFQCKKESYSKQPARCIVCSEVLCHTCASQRCGVCFFCVKKTHATGQLPSGFVKDAATFLKMIPPGGGLQREGSPFAMAGSLEETGCKVCSCSTYKANYCHLCGRRKSRVPLASDLQWMPTSCYN